MRPRVFGFSSRLLILALVGVACGSTSPNVPRTRLSPKGIFDTASPAIVRIEAGDKLGTGFVVDRKGIVATNLHVVAGEADIKIRFHDGTLYKVLEIAGVDPGRDLALLHIQPQKPLPTVKIGDSETLGAGDQVVAIGNPLGVLDNSISQGLVSAVRVLCSDQDVADRAALLAKIGKPAEDIVKELGSKHNRSHEEEDMLRKLSCSEELTILQISAAISQGSSGGPLFNQYGEVVGITTAIIPAGQNVNLAMPAKYLKPLVTQHVNAMSLEQFAKVTKIEETGGAEHVDTDEDTSVPARQIPDLQAATWDGCNPEDITETIKAIMEAIDIGAPAYNKLNKQGFEECFRIYEGTSLKLESKGACKGVRSAFGDGLLRASTVKSYKDKAWALRDTFDGMIRASGLWCQANGSKCPDTLKDLFKK